MNNKDTLFYLIVNIFMGGYCLYVKKISRTLDNIETPVLDGSFYARRITASVNITDESAKPSEKKKNPLFRPKLKVRSGAFSIIRAASSVMFFIGCEFSPSRITK